MESTQLQQKAWPRGGGCTRGGHGRRVPSSSLLCVVCSLLGCQALLQGLYALLKCSGGVHALSLLKRQLYAEPQASCPKHGYNPCLNAPVPDLTPRLTTAESHSIVDCFVKKCVSINARCRTADLFAHCVFQVQVALLRCSLSLARLTQLLLSSAAALCCCTLCLLTPLHLCTPAFVCSLTGSFAYSPTPSFPPSVTHSLPQSLTQSLTHSLTHPPTHPPTCSLAR